jgi:outer membrane protein TolC
VHTTQSSIPEFMRLSENARLRLSVLTGLLPEALAGLTLEGQPVDGGGVAPALMAPAKVLSLRPDIRAAAATLQSRTALAESATAELFPAITLSGFFGRSEGAFSGATTIWNVIAGAAVSLLDFGRIEGRIDAARAQEAQAFHAYRRTILEAVTEVETALTDYVRSGEQAAALQTAHESAKAALTLSQAQYKEGDISFIDVLDVQRAANDSEAQLVSARAAQAESLVRVYKSLGVY